MLLAPVRKKQPALESCPEHEWLPVVPGAKIAIARIPEELIASSLSGASGFKVRPEAFRYHVCLVTDGLRQYAERGIIV